jgi:DNA-binding NarL/FixJ family response regulator
MRYGALIGGVKQACNTCAKLAKPLYREVGRMMKEGLTQMEIARRLGRTKQHIGQVVQFLTGRKSKRRSKTHCPNGHRRAEANTYVSPNGWRACRVCMSNRQRAKRKASR